MQSKKQQILNSLSLRKTHQIKGVKKYEQY